MATPDLPPSYSEVVPLPSSPPSGQAATSTNQTAQAGHPTIASQHHTQARTQPPLRNVSSQHHTQARARPPLRNVPNQHHTQARTRPPLRNVSNQHHSQQRYASPPSRNEVDRHSTLASRITTFAEQQRGRVLYLHPQSQRSAQQQTGATQSDQHIVVITQPVPRIPSDYLWGSILVTIFCFLPTGIAAIIKSCYAHAFFSRGDIDGGRAQAWCARVLILFSLGIGICVYGVTVITVIYFRFAESRSYRRYG